MRRRATLESRLGGHAAELLANVSGADVTGETHQMLSVFVGDEVYELGAGGRWIHSEGEWWRRPLTRFISRFCT